MREQTKRIVKAFADAALTDEDERKAVHDAMDAEQRRRDRKEYLTQREACRLAQVTPQTLRRWVEKGILHPVKVSARRVVYNHNELSKYLCSED